MMGGISMNGTMDATIFYANAKFLLTGEYLVLQGARALALPLQLGQELEFVPSKIDTNRLTWSALKPDGMWFETVLEKSTLRVLSSTDVDKAQRLASILSALRQMNDKPFIGNDLHFTTRLGFDPEWGLGSSSTLIANLARWAQVDPYQLLKMTFGGSGYDIACAMAKGPILYQIVDGQPTSREVAFQPSFSNRLFFVYQGQKQSSAKEIGKFKANAMRLEKEIEAVNAITDAMMQPLDFETFCQHLTEHESILAHCLSREPLQKRFPDFEGVVKSLGAWGGDFFLAASRWHSEEIRRYFSARGHRIIRAYDELVL